MTCGLDMNINVDLLSVTSQYIHQCNSHRNPTGEEAFKNLLNGVAWAMYPIGDRMVENIKDDIPITFL